MKATDGDVVQIIQDTAQHQLPIGTVVTVAKVKNGGVLAYEMEDPGNWYGLNDEDFEPITHESLMPIATHQNPETHMEELTIRPFTPAEVAQEADLGIPTDGDHVAMHYAATLARLEVEFSIFASTCRAARRGLATVTQEDVRRAAQVVALVPGITEALRR